MPDEKVAVFDPDVGLNASATDVQGIVQRDLLLVVVMRMASDRLKTFSDFEELVGSFGMDL